VFRGKYQPTSQRLDSGPTPREPGPWQELEEIGGSLAKVSVFVVREMAAMPDSTDLVTRMVQVVGLMGSLLMDGRRALAQREADELRALLQVKSDFLRLTVHELRRPVGVVRGYLSMLEDGSFGQVANQAQTALAKLTSSAEEMASLVESLAAIVRLEDTSQVLQRRPCRLGHLVAEIVDKALPEAEPQGVTIERQLPEPDILVKVDRERLAVAVGNLLSNAIKFSAENGSVVVTVNETASEAVIAVTDHGPGIEPDELHRIFEPWQRSAASSVPGMGLGLHLVRTIVELHGGRVTVESQPGQGSTFTIRLPR
jgi:signal transduction histidine kinase